MLLTWHVCVQFWHIYILTGVELRRKLGRIYQGIRKTSSARYVPLPDAVPLQSRNTPGAFLHDSTNNPKRFSGSNTAHGLPESVIRLPYDDLQFELAAVALHVYVFYMCTEMPSLLLVPCVNSDVYRGCAQTSDVIP